MKNLTSDFYIVYSLDLYGLPVAYCEDLKELGRFFNTKTVTMTSSLSKRKTEARYKKCAFVGTNGEKLAIARWHENTKTNKLELVFLYGEKLEEEESL